MTPEEIECEQYLQLIRDKELGGIAAEIDKAVITQQFQELEQLRWIQEELKLLYFVAIRSFQQDLDFRKKIVEEYKNHKQNPVAGTSIDRILLKVCP